MNSESGMPTNVGSNDQLGGTGGDAEHYGDAYPGERGNTRQPKFGEWLRGVWASARNPTRDGMYVRTIRRTGRATNPGTWYELTDGKGKFWQYQAKDTVFVTPNSSLP